MKEIKTGVLMLLVCAAIYVQIDPRIWSGFCQLIGRLMTGRISLSPGTGVITR
ncbi:MAG TPA: hypothetical protein VJX28_01745 [Chthoniobacterales bacterium]|nr:hypothetical protein [Chthoniobacterales bacterium]